MGTSKNFVLPANGNIGPGLRRGARLRLLEVSRHGSPSDRLPGVLSCQGPHQRLSLFFVHHSTYPRAEQSN